MNPQFKILIAFFAILFGLYLLGRYDMFKNKIHLDISNSLMIGCKDINALTELEKVAQQMGLNYYKSSLGGRHQTVCILDFNIESKSEIEPITAKAINVFEKFADPPEWYAFRLFFYVNGIQVHSKDFDIYHDKGIFFDDYYLTPY